MKHLFGKLISSLLVLIATLYWGGRFVLDLIGYSTVPDDARVAYDLLQQVLVAAIELPLWIPISISVFAISYLIWMFRPDFQGLRIADKRISTIEDGFENLKEELEVKSRRMENDFEKLKELMRMDIDQLQYAARTNHSFLEDLGNQLKARADHAGLQTEGICREMVSEHKRRWKPA